MSFDWDLAEGEQRRHVSGHFIDCWDGQVRVFGNGRTFPVPPGWRLVDAYVGLVAGTPEGSRMKLPEGQVNVRLPSGVLLTVGENVPHDVVTVAVETPYARGCSNWAGPCLVFEKVGA